MTDKSETKATYIPLDDYEARGYKPFKTLLPNGEYKGRDEHFCTACKRYYKMLYDKGLTKEPFMPRCHGDVACSTPPQEKLGVDDETYAEMEVINDPMKWAEVFFDWKPRWYQREMLGCTSRYKVVRAGRRLGKTNAISIYTLWYAFTHSHSKVLVIAPYQSQVALIFREIQMYIDQSEILSDSIEIQRNSPPITIVFKNGSTLLGFASGKGQSRHSDQIRGQGAHLIVLDEVDMMNDYDIETIMAIRASSANCQVWASSTPRGWRKQFWEWCVKKDLRYREFHYISMEGPEWTQDAEDYYKATTSKMGFMHEYLAEFGEEAFGVFKAADIDECLYDYKLADITPTDVRGPCIMGVDWNLNAGTHIVIFEWTGEMFRLVHKTVVTKSEFTQMDGVRKIKELNTLWDPRFIYVDEGYGSAQIEMLKRTGLEEPKSGLYEKVVPIMMARSVEVTDQKSGAKIQRQAKQFMVELSANRVEQHQVMLPREEDTHVTIEPDDPNNADVGLVQQMRAFRVVRESATGQPVYSQDYEHTLTAMMLSILGFQMEFGGLTRTHYATITRPSTRIGENNEEITSRSGDEDPLSKGPKLPRAQSWNLRKSVPEIDRKGGMGACYRVRGGGGKRVSSDAVERRARRGGRFGKKSQRNTRGRRTW